MPPNPSFPYLTSSLRIAPSAEFGIAWGLASEFVNHKPGKSPLEAGLREWPVAAKRALDKFPHGRAVPDSESRRPRTVVLHAATL